jgi:hypothetical protein
VLRAQLRHGESVKAVEIGQNRVGLTMEWACGITGSATALQ